ncbi:MAG: TIGR00266 family protein [Polyangiaceae bacterium]
MRHQILHNPDFGVVQVQFDQPGEQIVSESGAMVARDTAIDMKTNLQGGLGGALKRKLLGGESLFQNTFTATAPGQTLWIAPGPEGAVERIDLQPGMEIFLQSGAYLASTPGVTLDTKWQGAKGFFSGGLFLLRAYGQGHLWFSAYGGLHTVDIGHQYSGYICDNTHMVAFTAGLQYNVTKLGGLKSLFLSGEGLVCNFQGQGRLWMQTRNPGSLAAFLHPFRRVQQRS